MEAMQNSIASENKVGIFEGTGLMAEGFTGGETESAHFAVAIERNMRIFEVFRALDIEMPIGQILFFLHAAKNEGASLREIAERSDTVMSTASRYLGNLSIYRRDKKPGLKLLTSKVHPENRAKLTIELTEKGRLILQQIM